MRTPRLDSSPHYGRDGARHSPPKRLGMFQTGRAVYIGPPSIWSNPFQRVGIGQARSVILFRAWLSGEATPGVLRCAQFNEAEIVAIERRRAVLLRHLPGLAGHNVRCHCSPWVECHGDALLALTWKARI